MKYVFYIVTVACLSALVSFTSEEVPEHVLYYGKKDKERQMLSFTNDTLFHITIPNNGGCCWMWGEYGGRYVTRNDSVDFYLEQMGDDGIFREGEKETYVKRGDAYHRVTPQRVMCKTYKKMKI